jgi:hypothetical protein
MTQLNYGPVQVVNPCTVLGYSQTPECDSRGNYRHTVVRIHVRGYYSAKSTGARNPVATDIAIRDQLAQPRQALTFVDGTNIITSTGIDACNGPFCRVIDVREMMGTTKTWEIELVIETYVNRLAKSPLLSNAWRVESDVDQDWYTSIVTRGHATFNTLTLAGVTPDSFRNQLIGSVPPNFKRDSIQVAVEDDNATVDYVVVDREQPINLIAKGITRIEATITQGIRNPGLEAMGDAALSAFAEGIGNTAAIFGGGGGGGDAVTGSAKAAGSVALGLGAVALQTALKVGLAIYRNLPRTFGNASVRVWGQRGTSKLTLYTAGQTVLLSRISLLQGLTAQSEASVTEDVAGQYIQLDLSYICGPILSMVGLVNKAAAAIGNAPPKTLAQAIAAAKKLGAQFAFGFPTFKPGDVPGILTSADVTPGQTPPGDGGTRGTYLGQLVAAALLGPGQAPPKAA